MKNNIKELSKTEKKVPGKVMQKIKNHKITRKVNSSKDHHVAIIGIALVTLICFSCTSYANLTVYAYENPQPLEPQVVVLQPIEVVEEKDTDGDGYKDSIDSCPDVAPLNDDGTGCEIPDTDSDGYIDTIDMCVDVAPTNDDGTGCEAPVVEEAEPEVATPTSDRGVNLVHQAGTDMSYMNVFLSGNADRYSNGYYCGEDNIAHENGTDAILVAMGSQYEYGQYYEVEISNYGTVLVKKVEQKGSTINNEGYIGLGGDSIELMVCDGFDPNGVGRSSNLGMYIDAIYKASY